MKWLAVALVLLVGCASPTEERAPPEVPEGEWGWIPMFEGFDSPIGMTTGPDGLLVIEQGGLIKTTDGATWFDLRDRTNGGGERGLLGLAFSDDAMFASYTDTGGSSVLSKFPLSNGTPGAEDILLTVNQPFANHNGGHIVYRDGMLYIGLGDGGFRDDPEGHGQNKLTLLGSILRIVVSGPDGYAIPADNPFVGDPTGADEILHYGLRNPWRFSLDDDGNMWIGDVGQDAWEEVSYADVDARGLNFGWNAYEGSQQYRGIALDHTPPIAQYANANGDCSVTGGHVYTGANETLQGWYLYGDFCSGIIRGYHIETGETRVLFETNLQISSFANIDDVSYLIHYGGTIYKFAEAA